MQHSGIRQVSKTLLTIAGILLLIIFGTRAASQASSLAAVGGQAKKASLPLFAQPVEVALLPNDSHRWFAQQAITASTATEPQVTADQIQVRVQVPVATDGIKGSVGKIATVAQQESKLAIDDSTRAVSSNQNSVYHSTEYIALQQSSTQLLDKSRQN